jgi:hypothetical protein
LANLSHSARTTTRQMKQNHPLLLRRLQTPPLVFQCVRFHIWGTLLEPSRSTNAQRLRMALYNRHIDIRKSALNHPCLVILKQRILSLQKDSSLRSE